MNINPVGNFNFNAQNLQQQADEKNNFVQPQAENKEPVQFVKFPSIDEFGYIKENKYDEQGNLLQEHTPLGEVQRKQRFAELSQFIIEVNEELKYRDLPADEK